MSFDLKTPPMKTLRQKRRRCEDSVAGLDLVQEVLVRPKRPGRAALREAVVEASTRMHAALTVRALIMLEDDAPQHHWQETPTSLGGLQPCVVCGTGSVQVAHSSACKPCLEQADAR